ncbi:MAG: preprotein translocase subunit SecY [Chloroflexi bacterium]|nr:preprotein translocase subunit SecY [Chloroflexota bacterium]
MRSPQAVARGQPGRPALLQAMLDAFRVPDLRYRILFTLAILVVFRLVAHVPVPGVDRVALRALFESNQLMGFLDLFSGGALRNLSVAAMGVYPYITSTIILQLLVPVIPRLQALSKEGEAGRQRINQITHWATVPIAIFQGYGQLLILSRAGVLPQTISFIGPDALPTVAMIVSMTAGTMLLVWMGELITERGIGNGISLIIFGGIVAGLPQMVGQGFVERQNMGGLLLLVITAVALVYLIVVFTEAQRRVPVQYGRSVFRGGRMYRQSGSTHLPLRVNSAGMIPLIFAFSIIILPGTVASYLADPTSSSFIARAATSAAAALSPASFLYWVLVFLLVVIFAFFYTLIIFQQQNLAENLQRNGGFIPGIRPGRPTQDFLNRVIVRITWGGALFLGFVAIAPFLITQFTGIRALQLSAASLLILVGVALDTMRQLEAQLLMRSYEGFLR